MSDVTAPPVLEVRGLSIAYATRGGTVHAVRDASLEVRAGETVALVGESGSGKTSLAFAVMRFLDANGRVTAGEIRFHGADVLALGPAELRRLRGARISMVFQDPQTSLNPVLRVGEQVAEVVREHLGLSAGAARARVLELFAQVNLPDSASIADRYPHELSGGQQQRVLIAMAFACDPELLIMDEPTTGLDVTTEARILDLIADMKARHRPAILYITHNLGVVARFCDRVVVMYAGEVVEEGPVARVFSRPLHPYTRGLLTSVPRLDWSKRDGTLTAIEGRLPGLVDPPRACVFAARCPERIDRCLEVRPGPEPALGGGFARCLRAAELADFRFGGRRGAGDSEPTTTPGAALVETRDLRCHYPVRRTVADVFRGAAPRAVRAVDGLSLDLHRAATLAVVGESGCGKTTLGRAIVGLLDPTAGEIRVDGQRLPGLARRRSRELRRRIQVIFQNPEATLNPQKTVGQTLRRPLQLLGLARGRVAEARVLELLRAVHLPEAYATRYPHELSGGEKQRVAIARAFAAEPDVIVCDEPLSALDVSVQAAILNLLVDLQRRSSTAYLFISHDLSVVRYLADRVAVMYMGKLCEIGSAADLFAPPYHPYTEALLSAIPIPDPAARQRKVRLEGPVPSPIDPGPGCRFHSRCPRKVGAICEREEPPAQEARPGHVIHCHIPLAELRQIAPVVEYREETVR
ncbi:MAG: ABC transporter ATP-binding protein [Candidatus Rokubacteria bacterium]|nr:ABC transporter ATP-binding protein [Candidatus Rokubacteria bacterium]